jgi:quercetin dioxygenase-like cupin family protein
MFCYHNEIKQQDLNDGTVRQNYPPGQNLNMLHSTLKDKTLVESHTHPEEQMGYIIKGSLEVTIDEEKAVLKAGDAYFVPPDHPHSFVAIGDTEAIDVFSPVHTFWSMA